MKKVLSTSPSAIQILFDLSQAKNLLISSEKSASSSDEHCCDPKQQRIKIKTK